MTGALESGGAGGDSFDAVLAAREKATNWAAVEEGDESVEEE